MGITNRREVFRKISQLAYDAQGHGWADIVSESERALKAKTKTEVSKLYYALLKKMKERGYDPLNRDKKITTPLANKVVPPIETPIPMPNQTRSLSQEATSSADGTQDTEPVSQPQGESAAAGYDPLLEKPVVEREYTSSGEQTHGSIPEPEEPTTPPPPKEEEPDGRFNDVGDLPPSQKTKAAKDMAKMLVDLYADKMPEAFRHFCKLSDASILELHQTGKVDFTLPVEIPIPTPHTIPLGSYVSNFNASIDQEFGVEQEWKDEIMPYVVEVLKKRGAGMTPEQVIMYMVGVDLAGKFMAAWGIKKALTRNLEYWMQQTKKYSKTNTQNNHADQPQQPSPDQPSGQPQGVRSDIPSPNYADTPTASDVVNSQTEIITTKAEEVDDDGNVIHRD